MFIGLTGSFASGKDTVATYLAKKGFIQFSLSDIIREDLRSRGQEITRENLILAGNKIRKKYGAGELALRALARSEKQNSKNVLFVSIRNPMEVEILRKHPPFELWFVDAPIKTRFERAKKRGRSDDFPDLEDFLEKELRENSRDPFEQQLQSVAKMSDVTIINDKDIKSLEKVIDELLVERAHHLD